MKKIKILIMSSLLFLSFFACDQEDAISNTIYNGTPVGVGFTATATSVIVPQEGITSTVSVQSTVKSTSDRTFAITVDESSNGSSADYSIGTLLIPANSFDGILDITFGNFDNLQDLTPFTLVLNLDLPEDVSVVGSSSTTFNYLKKIICNDFVLIINEDGFGSERNWEITDSTGAIALATDGTPLECANFGCPFGDVTGGEQNRVTFSLDDGVYTFTIFDSFGDGLFDGSVTGNYTLSCSLITHATGSGNFGGSQSTEFFVNQ
jgi:hypothetical protein